MKNAKFAAVAGALVAFASPAYAAPVFSDSFEADSFTLSAGGLVNFTISGGGDVDVVGPTYYGINCSDGAKCIDLDGTPGPATLTSRSSFAFAAGDKVRLSFDLSGNQRPGSDPGPDNFSSGFSFASSTLLLNYGFNYFGTDFILYPSILAGATSVGSSVGANAPFATRSLFFTAGTAGSLTFNIGTSSSDNYGPILDNVTLDVTRSAVPEPATWAMLIAGFGLMGFAMRRRRTTVAYA